MKVVCVRVEKKNCKLFFFLEVHPPWLHYSYTPLDGDIYQLTYFLLTPIISVPLKRPSRTSMHPRRWFYIKTFIFRATDVFESLKDRILKPDRVDWQQKAAAKAQIWNVSLAYQNVTPLHLLRVKKWNKWQEILPVSVKVPFCTVVSNGGCGMGGRDSTIFCS